MNNVAIQHACSSLPPASLRFRRARRGPICDLLCTKVCPYDGKLAREASLIAYGPQRRDGTVSWAGGQRKLRGLVQQGLERYTIREAITSAGHDVGNLIVHMPEELPHAWPWEHGGAWTELLESTGRASDGGGSKLQAPPA